MSDMKPFLSVDEVAGLLRVTPAEVERRIADGKLDRAPEGIPSDQLGPLLVLAALAPALDLEITEGATHQPVPLRACAKCGETGRVVYTGSVVEEGSLEFVHLVHTEVTNSFRCEACGGTWTTFKML